MNDGDVAVWLGAEPCAEAAKRHARRLEVGLLLAAVLRLLQQERVQRRQPRVLEPGLPDQVDGARWPGEVMDIFLVVPMGRRTVGVVGAFALEAGCADDPPARDREPDVVDAEVRKELSRRVKLVA